MLRLSTLAGVAPILVSCLLHVGFVGGALALGQIRPPREPAILEAELVTPEAPPPAVEPPRPTPAPPKPRRPEPTVLPRPLSPPPMPEATPEPLPLARVAEAAPAPATPAPATPSPEPSPVAQRPPSTAPAVSLPSSIDQGPAQPTAPVALSPPVTAKLAPEAPIQLAHPRGGYQVRPSYPSSARRIGAEGTTMLRVYVALDGQVTDVVVDRSAGHPDLDRAAVDAVRRWRFEPGRRGAEPIGMWVRLPVQFVLR